MSLWTVLHIQKTGKKKRGRLFFTEGLYDNREDATSHKKNCDEDAIECMHRVIQYYPYNLVRELEHVPKED